MNVIDKETRTEAEAKVRELRDEGNFVSDKSPNFLLHLCVLIINQHSFYQNIYFFLEKICGNSYQRNCRWKQYAASAVNGLYCL